MKRTERGEWQLEAGAFPKMSIKIEEIGNQLLIKGIIVMCYMIHLVAVRAYVEEKCQKLAGMRLPWF